MKKLLIMLLLVLGLTFIYNPSTRVGYVYVNNEPYNYIILMDPHSNTMRSYRGTIAQEWKLDEGFDAWMRDKVEKGMPFEAIITPFRQQQQQYKQYYEKRVP